MRDRLGSLVMFVVVALATTAGSSAGQVVSPGLVGELPVSGGFALVRWSGGSAMDAVSEADRSGCVVGALWITTPAGGWASYIPGAPPVANEAWDAIFPGGALPPGQALVMHCAPSARTPVTVVEVVDGDTVDVDIDGIVFRLRLILVDTPEVFGGAECYGRAASDFTRAALPLGNRVFLEKDVSETDAFGRLLRYVWLEDGTLFNERLVAEGYATLATYPPDVKYVDRIRLAQQVAYAEGRGLWGDCPDTPAPPIDSDVYFANCTEARAAGVAPLLRGTPGYRDALDRDGDGIACE